MTEYLNKAIAEAVQCLFKQPQTETSIRIKLEGLCETAMIEGKMQLLQTQRTETGKFDNINLFEK